MAACVCKPFKSIPLGTYRHFKGSCYDVIGEATHSETNETLIIYKLVYEDGKWDILNGPMYARPKQMFLDTVGSGKKKVKRFQLITPAEAY